VQLEGKYAVVYGGEAPSAARVDVLDETVIDEHAYAPDFPCSGQRRLP
jgi:hypothetical protein